MGKRKGREGRAVKKSEKQEKALVKKAMRGSPKAFGDLIETQQEYLYRMAYSLCPPRGRRPGRGAGEHLEGL